MTKTICDQLHNKYHDTWKNFIFVNYGRRHYNTLSFEDGRHIVKFWSVIKYKPKAGCEDEFIENLKPLKKILEGRREQVDYVQLPTGEVAEIVKWASMDQMMETQIDGLTWLDSVDHLLERYEEESRTDAFTGNVLEV